MECGRTPTNSSAVAALVRQPFSSTATICTSATTDFRWSSGQCGDRLKATSLYREQQFAVSITDDAGRHGKVRPLLRDRCVATGHNVLALLWNHRRAFSSLECPFPAANPGSAVGA